MLEIDLDVAVQTETVDGDAELVESVIHRTLQMRRGDLPAGATTAYVSVVLVDDDAIAEMNQLYRGIDAPTDVLSFPQWDAVDLATTQPLEAPLPLGDIVVSVPRAASQAREYGHSRRRELSFLVVHGLLHLLGYDDQTPDAAATMEACQDAVLDSLGLTRDSS